ncbi:hypothetical protein [Frankia sp. R82]|nr:hypothetical protein [Frankia sp. R82]MCM3882243.1 hypothetical protein [Frankia sp. R82]
MSAAYNAVSGPSAGEGSVELVAPAWAEAVSTLRASSATVTAWSFSWQGT